jgi:hypothetical protein
MGYRSEVAYKIKFENAEQWNVFLLEAKSKPETRLCFEDDALDVLNDQQEIRFYANWVKWYEDYEDVKCHIALMALVDEYNERQEELLEGSPPSVTRPWGNYLFRRIGESEDDCESQTGGDPDWDWIELNRSLQTNW